MMPINFEQNNLPKVEMISRRRYHHTEIPEFPEHAEREDYVRNFINNSAVQLSGVSASSITSRWSP